MGKFVGLLLTVFCIWAALEVYNEGVHGAFGGKLARFADGDEVVAADTRTTPQRAGAAVGRAHVAADERRNKLLED
jgi:hypothetical protein